MLKHKNADDPARTLPTRGDGEEEVAVAGQRVDIRIVRARLVYHNTTRANQRRCAYNRLGVGWRPRASQASWVRSQWPARWCGAFDGVRSGVSPDGKRLAADVANSTMGATHAQQSS